MFDKPLSRRTLSTRLCALAATVLLAGCAVVPKNVPDAPPPVAQAPDANVLPADMQRHRVALLVPLAGANGGAGQAIANAAAMALLDTNAANLRITNYDTSTGAASAAAQAVTDGNQLILGPLMADEIPAVVATAKTAKIPVISFSNDEQAAGPGVYVMGSLPGQSIERTVAYARLQGASRFAALVPAGTYGQRASSALLAAARQSGGSVVNIETFDRGQPSLAAAVKRLQAKGGFDAVLVADGGRIAAQAGPLLKPGGTGALRILGTELWSGDSAVAAAPSLRGALFAAVADNRYAQFAESYRGRFGQAPFRIATLGYDSVLLTLRVARDWKPGAAFPSGKLLDRGGFLGLDGAFRFHANGAIERAFEVREVRAGSVSVVSPAPQRFQD